MKAKLIVIVLMIAGFVGMAVRPKPLKPGEWKDVGPATLLAEPDPAPALQRLHAHYVKQFVENKRRFGYGRVMDFRKESDEDDSVPDSVIAAQQVQTVPPSPDSPAANHRLALRTSSAYGVKEVGLISTLNGAPALLGEVSMKLKSPPPTARELHDVEKSAIAAFDSGEDLIWKRNADGALRAVGALRARTECLECHGQKKAGDVLGALTYRIEYSKVE